MKLSNRNLPYVWFNGSIIESKKAVVSASSAASRYGIGVFEGIRAYSKSSNDDLLIFRLKEHLNRLFKSAKSINLPIQIDGEAIIQAIEATIIANSYYSDMYIRIDALAANSESWHTIEPAVLLISLKSIDTKESFQNEGASACISNWRRIDSSQMPPTVKAGANYLNSRYAYLEARQNGFDFPILLNLKGNVSESSGASIMCVQNQTVITPPISAQVLESITRNSLLEIAGEMKIKNEIKDLTIDDLLLSDEVFLCGTSVEILPITLINNKIIGDGIPGSITRHLNNEFKKATTGNLKSFEKWNFEVKKI